MTRELALALFVAYAAESSVEFKADLDATLVAVRARLSKAKDRAKRRQTLTMSMAS
jgi:hypothetical protein